MENQNQQRKQLEQRIVEKAMKDDQFREKLVNNTREAIEKELGVKLPEAIEIRVLEEDAQIVYLVLPPRVKPEAENELTEAELKQVAGGGGDEDTLWSAPLTCWLP